MIPALVLLVSLNTAPAMPELDQFCEDETDTHELTDLSPVCSAWLWSGDTCAESDAGCAP